MRTPHTQLNAFSRSAQMLLLSGALALYVMPVLAQAPPERLSDKDVKALIDQLDDERAKFEDNLDGKLKDSQIRTESVELKVSKALDDYKENVKKLKDRFTPDYSASAEAQVVLKQATNIDSFIKSSPAGTKGRSEWDREAAELARLAAVYGTTFPLPLDARVRRINDKEAATAAGDIATAAKRAKDDFEKEMSSAALPKADKDSIKEGLDRLNKQADLVKTRLNDGKPATAEVQQLNAEVSNVQRFIDAHPALMSNPSWEGLRQSLTKVQRAFDIR